MLRKALIASFIAKPKKRGSGEVEMKNTECRRLSQGKLEAGAVETVEAVEAVEAVKCLVLKDEDQPGQASQAGETEQKPQEEKVQEERGAGEVKREK